MQFKKTDIALIITIVVHLGGLWGMTCYNTALFAKATPINLLLCFALLIYTAGPKSKSLIAFFILCYVVGFAVECIGVNTSLLFGTYNYLPAMGPQLLKVPLLIGVNWIITMYCCGVALSHLSNKLINNTNNKILGVYKKFALPIDAAILATVFDWILEPAAIKLKFWQWQSADGFPPVYNYVCWFVISLLLMVVFNKLNFNKHNTFAVHLLMIQVLFFILINTLL
jgi:bisanhydrobacterioruberin hydratase